LNFFEKYSDALVIKVDIVWLWGSDNFNFVIKLEFISKSAFASRLLNFAIYVYFLFVNEKIRMSMNGLVWHDPNEVKPWKTCKYFFVVNITFFWKGCEVCESLST
jgi:hypothetical protein